MLTGGVQQIENKFKYHSEQTHMKNGHTRRNIVNIANNKGTKRVEEYDNTNTRIHNTVKKLTKKQIHNIKNSVFIPGLFKDCCRKMRSTTRKNNRRRN